MSKLDPNHMKFRDLLEQNYQWPDYYTWKFIVKIEIQDAVTVHLKDHEVTIKLSEKGNYVSITARKLVKSTDEVLEVYAIISKISGVMSL
jgi:putative lipoic acid-binding regulatory protein